MPLKIGGGRQLQEYDPHSGRYGGTASPTPSVCVNSQIVVDNPLKESSFKSLRRKERLDKRAEQSADPLLLDVYRSIQDWFFGCVTKVNERYSISSSLKGEVDIETRRFVIEIKSGQGSHFSKQFSKERAYAQSRHKSFIIYAPNMSAPRKREAQKQGFQIISSLGELKTIMSQKEVR